MNAAEFALIDVAKKHDIDIEDLKNTVKANSLPLTEDEEKSPFVNQDSLWSNSRTLSRREAKRRMSSKVKSKRELPPLSEIEYVLDKRTINGGV